MPLVDRARPSWAEVHAPGIPQGSLAVVHAKLLHGTACRCQFWNEVLGTTGDDFVIPAAQVVAQRPMQIAVKARHHTP